MGGTLKRAAVGKLSAQKDIYNLVYGVERSENEVSWVKYDAIQGININVNTDKLDIYGDGKVFETWESGIKSIDVELTMAAINNTVRKDLLGHNVVGAEIGFGSDTIKNEVSITYDVRLGDGTIIIVGLPAVKFSEPGESIDRSGGNLQTESIKLSGTARNVLVDGKNNVMFRYEAKDDEEAKKFRAKIHLLRVKEREQKTSGVGEDLVAASAE